MGRGRRRLGILGAGALALAAVVAACVDGVTPDCSAAGAHCEPSLDGSSDRAETAPDAPGDTSAADTFVPDAADADLDAGDEI
jgi:hypothetical protein